MPLDLTDAEKKIAILEIREEVKSSVEKDLFKYYRNLGSVVLTVLAAVGITVGWPSLKSLIDTTISTSIREKVDEQINPTITQARDAGEKARTASADASTLLASLRNSLGRTEHEIEKMEGRHGQNEAALDDLEKEIIENKRNIDLQKQSAQPLTLVTTQVTELAEQLKSLAELTTELSRQVEALSKNSGSSQQDVEIINQNLSRISQSQQENLQTLKRVADDPRKNRIVYVQFAGGDRSSIESVTDTLSKEGWNIPGEQRLATAAGKHEIRFFYEDDENAAKALASETDAAIVKVGLVGTNKIETRRFQPTKQSKLGIIELWLEIP